VNYKYDYRALQQQVPSKVYARKHRGHIKDSEARDLERIAPFSVWMVVGIFDVLLGRGDPVFVMASSRVNDDVLPDFQLVAPPVELRSSSRFVADTYDVLLEELLRYVYNEFDPKVPFFEALVQTRTWSSYGDILPKIIQYLTDRPDRLRFHDGVSNDVVKDTARIFFTAALSLYGVPWKHGSTVLSIKNRTQLVVDFLLHSGLRDSDDFRRMLSAFLVDDQLRVSVLHKLSRRIFSLVLDPPELAVNFWLFLWDPDDPLPMRTDVLGDGWGAHVARYVRGLPFWEQVRLLGNALRNYERIGGSMDRFVKNASRFVGDVTLSLAKHPRYKLASEVVDAYAVLYFVEAT